MVAPSDIWQHQEKWRNCAATKRTTCSFVLSCSTCLCRAAFTPHNRTLESGGQARPGRIKKLESISLVSDSLSQVVFYVLLRYSDNDRRDLVLFQFYATVDCRIFYPLHL